MSDSRPRVVLLAGPRVSSRIMFHGLAASCRVMAVIQETEGPGLRMIRGRLRRLGLRRTTGQLLFIGVNKMLAAGDRKRRRELIERYNLCTDPIPPNLLTRIRSVNDPEVVKRLRQLNPDAVVVNGTRLLSRTLLRSVNAPFLNAHLGITPQYRGVHGGYWALVEGDREHCGVTVHVVDEGLDTGGIVYQDTIHPEPQDSFNTYPLHQLAKALPLMRRAVAEAAAGSLHPVPSGRESRLWYHPTLLEYFRNRRGTGVK